MHQYHIAHIDELGQHMIIIPMDSSFSLKTHQEQLATRDSLQRCATAAKFTGTVVPVWLEEEQLKFIAPDNWHHFFISIKWNWVLERRNKILICN
jgi:hypothetical protein